MVQSSSFQQMQRIPAEELSDCKTWQLPVIDDQGRVIPSAEKEARDKRQADRRRNQESIEDVDVPLKSRHGMSAQDMQAIFDAAEKDGFEQGRNAGYEKGLAEGFAAGQQQGLMEMRQHLVAEQQRFQKLAQALLQPVQDQDAAIENLLVETICTLTRALVERELLTDSGDIVALVRKAVTALPVGSRNLRVYLNPDDLAAVETYAEEQQLDWAFVVDADLAPGGCRLETSESLVDFSVALRLEQLLQDFVNKQLAGGDPDDQVDTGDEGAPL